MPHRIADKERFLRKRLLFITPVAIFIILLIFISSDYVPIEDLNKSLGWKGELKVLPEITILHDEDPYESFLENRRLKTMTSIDLDVLDETGPVNGYKKKINTKEKGEKIYPPKDKLSLIPARPLHTDVPYSEDYVILKMVHPIYPPDELINGIEGEVTLELLVNESGKVENAWVLSLVGPKSFEDASMEAVKHFLFHPPTIEGEPSPMSIRFQISFKIKK